MVKTSKSRFGILMLVLIAILALNISGCGKESEPKLQIGESYSFGIWKVTLDNIEITNTIKSELGKLPSKTEKTFVLATMSFENTSASDRGLVSFENMWTTLLYSKDGKVGVHDGSYEILDKPFPYGYVNPGSTMTGVFPFEVPSTATDLTLSLYFEGNTILWEVHAGSL